MPPRVCFRCGAPSDPASSPYCPVCGVFLGQVQRGHEMVEPARGGVACLTAKDGTPVPLLGVALGGEVFGAHARMVLRQRYKNREGAAIEAVYTFPIPSDATLAGFAMECEGRRMEAEVKEREAAFQTYDEAISKGHGAALLEQERPNVFTASVGNLLPGEETVVEVTYLQRLTADEGALRLMIPTLVAPRYIPGKPQGDRTGHGSAQPTDAVPDADRVTPKIADVKYGLAMDVVFDLGREVTIESPSHPITVEGDGGTRRRVTFAAHEIALDRDIVLVAEGAPGVTAGLVCDRPEGDDGTFALTVVPDLFEAKKRSKGRAVVFLVDVSGSMAGESIAQAKRAMRLCLRHLSEGDLFDILPFSSSFSHFSSRLGAQPRGGRAVDLVPFTQMTLREADSFVDALTANGGTEMLQPLVAATGMLAGLARDRIVVLLTDGQVGNEAQILAEVTPQTRGARVYTFGIGTNVSDLLLRELAKRTKGAAEFIHPGERIDEKVTAQFARATAARVEDLSLKWIGVDAGEVAPKDPPALVDGEPWSVYGRYEAAGTGRVEIRGTLGGEPFYLEVPMELSARADRPALTSLWAGARVRDLENVDPATLGRRAELQVKRIVDLCVRHRIASKHTSFIVVEKRTGDRRAQGGAPETRAVPVNAPAGWAMFQGAKGGAESGSMRAGSRGGGAVGMRAMAAPMSRSAPAGARPPVPASPMRMSPPPAAAYAPPPPAPGYGAPPGFGPPPPAPEGAAGFGPPPPPPMAAPMGAPPGYGAPSSPSPARPPLEIKLNRSDALYPPKEKKVAAGGLLERAKKALGFSDGALREEGGAAPSSEMDAEASSGPGAAAPGQAASVDRLVAREEIGAMFARQLASGLWESRPGAGDELAATTECLVRCAKEGVDTSNPIYGAQIQKAVEALLALVEGPAREGQSDDVVIQALLAMAAVSTGKRARRALVSLAEGARSAKVKELAPALGAAEEARKRLG